VDDEVDDHALKGSRVSASGREFHEQAFGGTDPRAGRVITEEPLARRQGCKKKASREKNLTVSVDY